MGGGTVSSIVFVDSWIADIERLLAGLAADVQAFILDPTQDGITQIAVVTAAFTNLDSIHIVSHGSSGTLYLGSTVLAEGNLDNYQTRLSQIGASNRKWAGHTSSRQLLMVDETSGELRSN